MANASILAAFERMWQHVVSKFNSSVADWNQNDNTALDYVKNRPFYTETVQEVLYDGTVTTSYGWNNAQYDPIGFDVIENAEYEVIYDGTTYNVVGTSDGNGSFYIGSYSLWWNLDYDETEPPFCYANGWFGASEDGEHTVKISGPVERNHYIDPKYIKDMYSSETIFQGLEEQSITTVMGSVSAYGQANGSLSLIAGQTYTVVFDGATYECVAYEYPYWGAICIGNGSIIGATDGNEEPFCFDSYSDGSIYLDTLEEETHTISISTSFEDIKQIDKKYLPQHEHQWSDIKDKPFGDDEIIEATIEERSVITIAISDYAYADISRSLHLIAGQTYTVVFDGVTYECVAYENVYDSDWVDICIGNVSIIGATGGNEEPFCFQSHLYDDGTKTLKLLSAEAGTYTVSISGYMLGLKQLDNKYISQHKHKWNDITDRPFGEVPTFEILVDDLSRGDYQSGGLICDEFVVGDTYSVDWNGTLYEDLVCHYDVSTDGNTLGGNSYPFAITCDVIQCHDGTDYVVSIFKQNGTTIKTLDPQYLPDHEHTVSDIADLTATATELNYVDGVTSNIQTQLNAKVPSSRTVNGKALSANISLTASDVGADLYVGSSAPSNTENILWVDTSVDESDLYYTKDETDAFLATKAPSGYGLGVTSSPSVSDINTCLTNGFYLVTNNTANVPSALAYSTLYVHKRVGAQVMQTLTALLNNGDSSGIQMIRRSTDSGATWTEEWVNPPMTLGIEYRTTERWNGKTVYVCMVAFGSLPNATWKSVSHGLAATNIVRAHGTLSSGAHIPFSYNRLTSGGGEQIDLLVTKQSMFITSNTDTSAATANVTIWYTKD